MKFKLVDRGWAGLLDDCLNAERSHVRIVAPFIKKNAAERLVKHGDPSRLQVITRFNLADFASGVSDVSALRLLLEHGAEIRGIKNLHAKLYIFGRVRAVGTSANLTDAGLLRNHEFGFDAEEQGIVAKCCEYFDALWAKAGRDVTLTQLHKFDREVEKHLAAGGGPATRRKLNDHGADAGLMADGENEDVVLPWQLGQAFVKFFGQGSNRADWSLAVLEEVERAGCHWACTYPAAKRPTSVEDGATMFMARLVQKPDDIVIFGRARALRYQPGRDDASPADIKLRSFKAKWPRYIRVRDAEFVAGEIGNGVPLSTLMDALESNAVASTQRNAAVGTGNTNPRRAYMQQPAVELTSEGARWVNARLEAAFRRHGKLTTEALAEFDWPALPRTSWS